VQNMQYLERKCSSFCVDNIVYLGSIFRSMAEQEKTETKLKLATPGSIAVDAVLVVAFFIYMYTVVSTHVPSEDPKMIHFWGAFTASCLAALFWLALQMFRVVYKAQRESKKK